MKITGDENLYHLVRIQFVIVPFDSPLSLFLETFPANFPLRRVFSVPRTSQAALLFSSPKLAASSSFLVHPAVTMLRQGTKWCLDVVFKDVFIQRYNFSFIFICFHLPCLLLKSRYHSLHMLKGRLNFRDVRNMLLGCAWLLMS